MGVKENLIAARALIDTPEKWIKGKASNEVDTCFCSYGAILHRAYTLPCRHEEREKQFDAMDLALVRATPKGAGGYIHFNDHPDTTHADVMALFDRAIAAVEVAA